MVCYTAHLQYSSAVKRDYIGFECERIWDSDNYWFLFKFDWILPPFIRHRDVIGGFSIIPRWRDESERPQRTFSDPTASRIVFFPFEQVVIYIHDNKPFLAPLLHHFFITIDINF